MPRCSRCSLAHYCGRDCQREHWPRHKRGCRAALAAMARHANEDRLVTRERLTRAVRERESDEGPERGDEDDLCVICQSKQDNPMQVCEVSTRNLLARK